MASESTTRWPLLNERVPMASAPVRATRRKLPRSVWLLTGLAFLCGGLVSAAGFSIGWRHQAQRNTAAETALATATARVNRLTATLVAARRTIAQDRQAEARANASARATARAASSLAADAGASGRTAGAISTSADGIAAGTTQITRELQTLLTYLTTTPSGQIDSGYVASQAGYLTRQLAALQDSGGRVGTAITSFEAAVRKLAGSAAALSAR